MSPTEQKQSEDMKNTPELWDKLWEGQADSDFASELAREENGIRWQRIEQVVLNHFQSFKELKVVEIGAGMGTNSALMADRGAQVSIMDYSDRALALSSKFFGEHDLKAEYIKQNVLKLEPEFSGKFDISMSFGLAEHFKGADRVQIIKSHVELIRPGGMTLISVPNSWNLPYRLNKFVSEKTGHWKFGEEYPFSSSELKKLALQSDISEHFFIGDSFIKSLHLANPGVMCYFIFGVNPISKLFPGSASRTTANIQKKERGSPLDKYMGYALVLCAVRKCK